MLILAMDANFRLTNGYIKNEIHDPELGPGWGHIVDREPYNEHIKKYVSEVDVSSVPSPLGSAHLPLVLFRLVLASLSWRSFRKIPNSPRAFGLREWVRVCVQGMRLFGH